MFKIKTIYKTLVAVAFCGVTMTSCSDSFLDKSPYGEFSDDQLTEENLDDAMLAAYAALGGHLLGNNEAFSGPVTNWVFDVRSDDAYKGGGGLSMESNILDLELSNINSDSQVNTNKWKNDYYGIARLHQTMGIIQAINPDDLDEKMAELRLMRGHYYFDLIRIFERIPYLEQDSDPSSTRADEFTREEIYDKIAADFQYAWENLAESTVGDTFDKYAAAAYMCKLKIERQEWAEAITWADEIIGKRSLYNNFLDMSKIEFDHAGEALFSVPFNTDGVDYPNANWANLINVTFSEGNLFNGGDDFFLASQNLANAFRTDANGLPLFDTFNDENVTGSEYTGNVDPRLDFTLGRIGMPFRGNTYTDTWVRDPLFGGMSGKKFLIDPTSPDIIIGVLPHAASPLDYKLIRYAEVLLWKAEAMIESGSDVAGARLLINEVRAKAKRSIDSNYLPLDIDTATTNYVINEYSSAGWDVDYARKALRMERRLELAMEGHRWFDLVRWGVAAEVMNTFFNEEDERSYISGAQFTENETYMPIPMDEMSKAGDLYIIKN